MINPTLYPKRVHLCQEATGRDASTERGGINQERAHGSRKRGSSPEERGSPGISQDDREVPGKLAGRGRGTEEGAKVTEVGPEKSMGAERKGPAEAPHNASEAMITVVFIQLRND